MNSGFTLQLSQLPSVIRILIILFQINLIAGFLIGVGFVGEKTDYNPQGVHNQYNGNEAETDPDVLFFKKSQHEILTTIHSHLLSLSVIFLIHGLLVYGVRINPKFRKWLMLEPLLSLFITFGSIYFLWKTENSIWTYIIMISGILMTSTFLIGQLVVVYSLLKGKKVSS